MGNVQTHAAAIGLAAETGVSVLLFPELSLIGYELDLAADHAIAPTDNRLAPLAKLAAQHQMVVVVGASLQNEGAKPHLGAILFGADGSARTYAKMHLGGEEPTYFAPGQTPLTLVEHGQQIGLAICADSAKPSHPGAYAESGCNIYATSVFLNAEWYETDCPRLIEYATRFPMLVVMANHAASVGTYSSVGNSAVWAPGGELLAKATDTESALVVATWTGTTWCGDVISMGFDRNEAMPRVQNP